MLHRKNHTLVNFENSILELKTEFQNSEHDSKLIILKVYFSTLKYGLWNENYTSGITELQFQNSCSPF